MQLGVELSGLRVTALHVDVGQQVRAGSCCSNSTTARSTASCARPTPRIAEAAAGVQLAQVNLKRGEGLAQAKLISAAAFDELRAPWCRRRRARRPRAPSATASRCAETMPACAHRMRASCRAATYSGQVIAAGAELLALIRQASWSGDRNCRRAELARVPRR
jgi:multidrug resistance efflux pump